MDTPTRSGHLGLRLTPQQQAYIERAAALTGRPVSDFSVAALMAEATEMLRRERDIVVKRTTWDEFSSAVEQPAEVVEGFADLMRRPSVFGGERLRPPPGDRSR